MVLQEVESQDWGQVSLLDCRARGTGWGWPGEMMSSAAVPPPATSCTMRTGVKLQFLLIIGAKCFTLIFKLTTNSTRRKKIVLAALEKACSSKVIYTSKETQAQICGETLIRPSYYNMRHTRYYGRRFEECVCLITPVIQHAHPHPICRSSRRH